MGKIIKYGISYGGNGGNSDMSYNDLEDKPSINNVTLSGNKSTSDLGLFDGDYNNLTNQPTIPSKTSDLTNDSDFVTDNPTFTEAQTRANIASGESFAIILGKIMKFFTDLKTVAFTNSYTDLDNKPTIPSAQIQSDWSQSDSAEVDYIKNKPTIPTVNNATLTLQKNGIDVQIFTANQSTDVTANITVPTKTSEITNDSGFITSSALPTVNNSTITIQKNGTDVDSFTTNAASAKSINITVPTKVSELTNDSGYTTNIGTVTQVKIGTSEYNPTNGIVSLPNYPTVNNATLTIQKNGTNVNTFTANASSNVTANITVPTKTSDITNDSNFVASTSATWKNIVGAWSSSVNAAVGATSVSVSNPMNSTNITVDPFCQNSSGTQIGIKTMSVTASTITLTFDALTVATTFKCRVMSN